jgi:hypothetical protein
MPVPPHRWHRTILSPFLRVPFPSQFLHGFFFSPMLFRIQPSKFDNSKKRGQLVIVARSGLGGN